MEDLAAAWTRQTPWRQGHVLGADAAAALGLAYPHDPAATRAVVISHDCDIAIDELHVEGAVEVIVGHSVLKEKANGNLYWGKSTRALLLEYLHNGEPHWVELPATEKTTVTKAELAKYVPDGTYELPATHRAALQSWLAARYRRSGFPDEFNRRMKNSRLDERLTTILDTYGKSVTAMFFEVDGGKEVNRSDGSTYELAIVLAYDPGDDPDVSAERADKAATEISDEFEKRLYDKKKDVWKDVRLKGCVPISEDELTVAKAKLLQERRVEHLTLRDPDKQAAPLGMRC